MIFTSAQEMIIALLEQNAGSYLMKRYRHYGTKYLYRLMCNDTTPVVSIPKGKIDALIELGAIEKIDNKYVLSKKYLDQKNQRPGINQAAGR